MGVAANVVGSWIAYAIGYFGRIDVPEKHGRALHIKPQHLALGGQLVPAPRRGHGLLLAHAAGHPHVHLPAGRRRQDALLALHRSSRRPAASPGCSCWTFIGKQAGDNWRHWKHYFSYLDYVVLAAIVVGIVYLVVRRRRRPAAETV